MRTANERQAILNQEYQTKIITQESINDIFKYPHLYRGSVKTSLGYIFTTKEYDQWKNKILNTKLP